MTASSHEKVLKQIGHKEGKKKKYLKHSTPRPRKFGESTKKCVICGRTGGHISKYQLKVCRQCFREHSQRLGFKQYR